MYYLKYLTFDKGVTASNANHVCNVAKEKVALLESELNRVSFINETLSLMEQISNSLTYTINKGITELDPIIQKIEKIQKYHSLIAWFREAIKIKEDVCNKKISYQEWLILNNKQHPSAPELILVNDEEVYDTFTIKELQEYHSLKAEAAVIGKLIHPNGAISNARKELFDTKTNPNTLIEQSGKLLISTKTGSLHTNVTEKDTDLVDSMFFELQNKHREYSAKINSFEYRVRQTKKEMQLKNDEIYKNSLNKVNEEIQKLRFEYDKYLRDELNKNNSLKIIVPNNLESLFNELLGK